MFPFCSQLPALDQICGSNFEHELGHEYQPAYGLGVVYYEASEFSQARIWFERALERQPGDRDAQFQIARCLVDLRSPREALAVCGAILKQYPTDIATIELRQQILSQRVQP